MYQADIIVLCTSDRLSWWTRRLRPGTVVCDAAKPFNMPRHHGRDDIVVIEGGQVELPHPGGLRRDFDCRPNRIYACMAEPMVLALSGRIENFCLGDDIPAEKVAEIAALGRRHGFRPVLPRNGPRPLSARGRRRRSAGRDRDRLNAASAS